MHMHDEISLATLLDGEEHHFLYSLGCKSIDLELRVECLGFDWDLRSLSPLIMTPLNTQKSKQAKMHAALVARGSTGDQHVHTGQPNQGRQQGLHLQHRKWLECGYPGDTVGQAPYCSSAPTGSASK